MIGLVFQQHPLRDVRLPASWQISALADLANEIKPGFPSGQHNREKRGVPHLRPMNVSRQGTVDVSDVKHVEFKAGFEVKKGDIIFNNTNSPELIGKTAVCTLDEPLMYSNHMTRIRMSGDIDSAFVAHQLHWLWMTGYFRHRCTNHVNQASISSGPLADTVPLAIPPLAEQRRIVAEIEKQFTRLDEATRVIEFAHRKLKRSARTLLSAASRLASRREGESGSGPPQLDSWSASLPRKVLPDPDITLQVPDGWTLRSLDQLTSKITSGSRDWSPYYGRGTSTFILAQNIRPRKLDLSFRQLVDAPANDSSKSRSSVEQGDLLITIVGANTGDVCPVEDCLIEHYVCQSVALVRPLTTNLTAYLSFYLNDDLYGRAIWNRYMYGAGRPHLSFEQLRKTPVLLPPPQELDNWTSQMQALETLVSNTERAVEQLLFRSKRLRQSILARAFAGQLSPQDPDDEPVSVLLERIRAGRTTITTTQRRHRRQRSLTLQS